MTAALRQRQMTREEFFEWAEAQEERYEFDGFAPVAMTGGNNRHSKVIANIHSVLRSGLAGTGCQALGPDAGLATVGATMRYPDALVTCSQVDDLARAVPDVVIVFEVLSPGSDQLDRVIKLREYAAVPSILRYIIVETTGAGLTVMERARAGESWTATSLLASDMLRLPEIGIDFPVADIYANTDLAAEPGPAA